MNRLERAFAHGKAFIPFITAGDPSLPVTRELVLGMAAAGADLIELGIPFSDPIAEGEVIQRADVRSLSGGTTTDRIFDLVESIREECDVPLAFMTYVNPVFTYGPERFMQRCQQGGVDAIIVPDLPFEEKGELQPYCDRYGVQLISLIAPTSRDRIHMIAREAQGFVYCVSSMGVTGVRAEIGDDIGKMVEMVKEVRAIPCAVGFGISTPEQAETMSRQADGVIVGSAIVRIIEQHGPGCLSPVLEYVETMVGAVKGNR